jgi:CDP-paratose 2-epimerase
VKGKIYNIGGGKNISFSLKELTEYCMEITGNTIPVKGIPANRIGDIPIYITDHSLVTSETGWIPQKDIKMLLGDIYKWLKKDEQQLKNILAI